ncbi:MAG: ankyrin repeat domain-containing protein [Pseudomonadota bacterium]
MKTIKRILATTVVSMLICATPICGCEWLSCDDEFVDNMNSLYALSCKSDLCFRHFDSDIVELFYDMCPSCSGTRCDCFQVFRQNISELVRILRRVPVDTRNFRPDIAIILSLICKHSGEFPFCHEDYLKDTRKLMKLMSLKQGSITVLGTFKAAKEGHKGVTSNKLLDTLGRSSYNRYITLRMALAAAQLENAALMSDTSLLMLASAMGDLKVVADLLAKGENVNARNEIGKTALIFAVSQGHPKVVQTLLKAGADPNLKDKDGATAASLAKKNGRYDVLKILEQASVK